MIRCTISAKLAGYCGCAFAEACIASVALSNRSIEVVVVPVEELRLMSRLGSPFVVEDSSIAVTWIAEALEELLCSDSGLLGSEECVIKGVRCKDG